MQAPLDVVKRVGEKEEKGERDVPAPVRVGGEEEGEGGEETKRSPAEAACRR